MDMTVNNRFAILLAEKRVTEKRNISLVEVAEATKVSRQALYKWENNSINRFEVRVIDALCEYFGIQPGDLFHYVKAESGKSGKITVKSNYYLGDNPMYEIESDEAMGKIMEMIEQPHQGSKGKGKLKEKSRAKKKPAA